ncbi:MAG: hypothetical protein U0T32_04975 [Chitinophagales bacterium]
MAEVFFSIYNSKFRTLLIEVLLRVRGCSGNPFPATEREKIGAENPVPILSGTRPNGTLERKTRYKTLWDA